MVVIRYLIWVGNKASRQVTGEVLHSVMDTQQAEELMRSYGEQLVERGVRRGLKQGRLQGRAEAIVDILAARGVGVGDEARQRILTCTDAATLDRWFARALNASTPSDVMDDQAS
ncbi:RpnC/YadD family protein [Archangium violaceum]|uniref:hypothetical protein n=1 Tax=Archangium violaceum TaxID=83451 RepID=UPI0036DE5071